MKHVLKARSLALEKFSLEFCLSLLAGLRITESYGELQQGFEHLTNNDIHFYFHRESRREQELHVYHTNIRSEYTTVYHTLPAK